MKPHYDKAVIRDKQRWIPQTSFTAVCGASENKDNTNIVHSSQNASIMGYCNDCDNLEYLYTIITHYGIEKKVCTECLKHYHLRMTKIVRPKWAGVLL